jgi:hypothetical protein
MSALRGSWFAERWLSAAYRGGLSPVIIAKGEQALPCRVPVRAIPHATPPIFRLGCRRRAH